MMLVVSSFAMAGSRVSLTGGIYAYVEVAFGSFVGFLTGFVIWFSCLLASASVANALAGSVGTVMPVFATGPGKAAMLAVIYGLLAALNVRGVATGTRVIEVVTLAKLLPLLLLLAAGVFYVGPTDLRIDWVPPANVATTSITLIFAFVGVEYTLLPSGEVRDPARTIPRALFLALVVTTLLYLGVQLVAHAILGPDLARSENAPLADAAARIIGPWGRALMIVGASVSMLGFLSGDALTAPRSLFAFARDGFFPSALARVHPTYQTPWVAIMTHAPIVWLAAQVGTFSSLVQLSTASLLIAYLVCCLAAIELRRRDVRMGGTPFELPFGPLPAAGGCVVLAWMLLHASAPALAVTGTTVAAGALLYAIREVRLRRVTPSNAATPSAMS